MWENISNVLSIRYNSSIEYLSDEFWHSFRPDGQYRNHTPRGVTGLSRFWSYGLHHHHPTIAILISIACCFRHSVSIPLQRIFANRTFR